MKTRIIHLVSADADYPLLRSVAALHLAERRLGADSLLFTSRTLGGVTHQHTLPVAGRTFGGRLATGKAIPGWLRRFFPLPPEAVTDTMPQLIQKTGIAERVAALRPDFVHLHAVRGEIGSAEELATLPGKLCWSLEDRFWMNGAENLDRKAAEALMKRSCQRFAAMPFLADEAAASPLFPGRRCDLVPPTVDPNAFHPDAARREMFRQKLGAGNAFVVMTDGRTLTPFFAEVLKEAKRRMKKEILLLSLHQPECRLTCPVRLITDDGSFAPRQLSDAYRAADCWLAAEEKKRAVLPLALLEAAACATPALALEESPAAALIAPEWSGLLVKEKDAAEWANAMVELSADREGYGASASELVFTSYSPLNAARRILDKYKDTSLY